jgi:hypothetical protein
MMTWLLRKIGIAIGVALARYALRAAGRRRARRAALQPAPGKRSAGVGPA